MKKTIKRTLAIVMAVAMLFALSATAFATGEENSVTVYLKLQSATVPSGSWSYTLYTLINVVPIDGFVPVTVTKTGNITVKDVVNTYLGSNLVTCTACGTNGCVHSNTAQSGETVCDCSNCSCTWTRAEDYYTPGTYRSVLNSIMTSTYDEDTDEYDYSFYTNAAHYTDNGDGTTTYDGTSWEYFVGTSSTDTAIYSHTQYMDQYVVTGTVYITLSFDRSTFTYPNN